MFYNNKKLISKIILLFTTLLLPSFAFTQADDLATQLQLKLESNDTTGAKKLLAKGLQQNRYFLLVHCSDLNVDGVEIQIQDSHQIVETLRESLPYLSIQDTVNENIVLAFTLISGSSRIAMTGTYRPIDCSRSHLAYLILRRYSGTLDLKYCLKLPAPSDTIIFHDTIYFPIPPPKFFNYRVLSSGGIALGSFIWFLRERDKANDDFDKYESAVLTSEATKLRHEVEKSRTRRDIAGTISLVSGVAFSYFFVRDLFRSETKQCSKHDVKSVDSTSKIIFGLEPNPMTNDVQVTMSLIF